MSVLHHQDLVTESRQELADKSTQSSTASRQAARYRDNHSNTALSALLFCNHANGQAKSTKPDSTFFLLLELEFQSLS